MPYHQAMKSYLLASFTLLIALSAPAAMADDVKAIDQLFATWRQAVENADIPLYTSVLHEDVRLIPPGADVIAGREAYRAFLGPVFEGATYQIKVTSPPDTTVLGDVAVSEYAYVIHLKLKNPGEAIQQEGAITASRTEARYFDVLRKDESGQWKVWRHTWQ